MKGLLKILAVFGLTTPLAVNIVACNSSKSNSDDEVTENTNVQELLQKAKDQVNLGLGHLIDKNKNLTFEDQFTSLGLTITDYLNSLPNDSNSIINEKKIKDVFLKRLQEDINNFLINDYLIQSSELKPLFGGISIDEILTIDINQTILTKVPFQWQGVDFGVADYDPSNPAYNITMWHKLTAQLKLKLTYKNESNIKSTYDFASNFNFNYANKGANLVKLIDASTAQVQTALRDFIIQLSTNNSSALNNEIKNAISIKVNNSKVNIDTIEIVSTDSLHKYDKYNSGDYMFKAITKPTVEEAIASLKAYLTPVATKFATKVTNWIGTGPNAKKITADQSRIDNFGKCTISNWTVSGLTLKPMSLDFVTSRSGTPREWAEQTATALGTIFCTKGSFAQGRIDLTTDGNLTIYMNPADFDDFVSQDKKMSDISDYISQKLSAKAKKDTIINNSISLILNGLWKIDPTLSNSSIVKKVDDETFLIKRGIAGMHGYNYLTIGYNNVWFLTGSVNNTSNKRILFNNWIIKKANSNVW